MGAAFNDEYVIVRRGKHEGDPSEITVNCPDKVGLGCDFARTVFEFGLSVVKGDFSTDGRWCFVVLWVVPRVSASTVRWPLLKQCLEHACPSAVDQFLLPCPPPPVLTSKNVFLLQVCSSDRTGLLHGVAKKLWEMELTIHKVKVSTSPDDKAVNLFFVTDNRNELFWKKRVEEVCDQVRELLGDTCSRCDLNQAGPECGGLGCAPLPLQVANDLFTEVSVPLVTEKDDGEGGDLTCLDGAHTVVTLDNSISPVHSLLQVTRKNRKGLLYDCLRTLKDMKLQVAHGRVITENGISMISVFVLRADGQKITDVEEKKRLCICMHTEVEHPLRVAVVTRGPDTELHVATPIEICGRGRPRVLYDVTLALKQLDICIFKADIGRHVVANRHWEIYRFLLVDRAEVSWSSSKISSLLAERVRHILMG
ncbi:unnamed protein product [Sphagnum jensenii]|uniref:Uncharacterized protein n=2 Tax=Sphagnum jensenii TaxID=128206 RepID=A0ABP1ATQ4_9BRYO